MKLEPHQVAVITGGASGIGFALAAALAQRGLHLALLDVEQPALDAAAERLRALHTPFGPPRVEALCCDVSDAEAMQAAANEILSRCNRVDLLVNNAGVGGALGPQWLSQPQDWQWVMNVNVFGVANGIRAFVPAMLQQQGSAGHVVNIASIAGLTAPPFLSPYVAAKHAVVGMSESLAAELQYMGPQIRVSVVCPGGVQTRIMQSERNRPAELKVAPRTPPELLAKIKAAFEQLMRDPMPADELAGIVLAGIERDDFYILTHADHAPEAQARADRVVQAAKAAAA
ncbi:MAG: SDR family NAD(P)-dependent oxidoreductase [Ferrovibrio sp.]|uniref:SDR family NAD(P)-dependent oxidoreductase n=1 Tax=Ferrovibrio sp. TaxID=1917215 RepID=UPI002608E2BB|nr:SDR family NAD(P)-dependent oxidoreductase [Ferrovibrio sp.]MCW0233778.1 SDR family NAD(P)-dependent oxidoreductase [Ferrovibrio sp.]